MEAEGQYSGLDESFCNWCSWRDKCALEYKVEA